MAKPVELTGNAEVAEASSDLQGQLEALMNDGSDDIIFGIDASTTSIQRRTLKAGEQYNAEKPIQCKTIFYKSASGSQPFRIWGTKD